MLTQYITEHNFRVTQRSKRLSWSQGGLVLDLWASLASKALHASEEFMQAKYQLISSSTAVTDFRYYVDHVRYPLVPE